jgi:hypothetical protein
MSLPAVEPEFFHAIPAAAPAQTAPINE